MPFYGADPEQLDKLSKDVAAAAKSLDAAKNQLTAALAKASGWTGPAADRFRSDWKSRYAPSLGATGQSLQTAGTALTKNASEQRSTSEVGDAGSVLGGTIGSGGRDGSGNGMFEKFEKGIGYGEQVSDGSAAGLRRGVGTPILVPKEGAPIPDIPLTGAPGEYETLPSGLIVPKGSVPPPVNIADQDWATKTVMGSKTSTAAEGFDRAGKVLGVAGTGLTVYLTYQEQVAADQREHPGWSNDQVRNDALVTAGTEGAGKGLGAMGGAETGAEVGAIGGAELGTLICPGVGTAIGGVVGGAGGAVVGGIAGSHIGGAIGHGVHDVISSIF